MKTTMKTNTRLALIEAYGLLKRGRRWIKQRYCNLNDAGVPCYCAMGAIYKSTKDAKIQHAAAQALARQIPDLSIMQATERPQNNVIAYNDNHRRTYSEIALLFRKAIASLA